MNTKKWLYEIFDCMKNAELADQCFQLIDKMKNVMPELADDREQILALLDNMMIVFNDSSNLSDLIDMFADDENESL